MALEGSTAKDVQTYRTRKRIKSAARRLFAERGVNAVSIRDIVKAAGQKNIGAIHYHFQSKDALILEIASEVARAIDSHRIARLDALEAAGGPRAIHEVVRILIAYPERAKARRGPDDVSVRLVNTLFIEYRELLFRTLSGEADLGTRRCMVHIARFLPEIPQPILRQRLIFALLSSSAILATREVAEQQPDAWRALWGNPNTVGNLIDAIVGLLGQPASVAVLEGFSVT